MYTKGYTLIYYSTLMRIARYESEWLRNKRKRKRGVEREDKWEIEKEQKYEPVNF